MILSKDIVDVLEMAERHNWTILVGVHPRSVARLGIIRKHLAEFIESDWVTCSLLRITLHGRRELAEHRKARELAKAPPVCRQCGGFGRVILGACPDSEAACPHCGGSGVEPGVCQDCGDAHPPGCCAQ